MGTLSRVLCLTVVVLIARGARAELVEDTFDDPTFGKLVVYHATAEPKGVLLFASGTGGWNADLAAVASEAAKLDYVVAGINLDDYLTRLDRSNATCADLAGDFDRLNRLMEERYPIATHQPPILLGYGAGAALTYAALVQAPHDQFHAGLAVDFCPVLPLRKALCKGSANLERAPRYRTARACCSSRWPGCRPLGSCSRTGRLAMPARPRSSSNRFGSPA